VGKRPKTGKKNRGNEEFANWKQGKSGGELERRDGRRPSGTEAHRETGKIESTTVGKTGVDT